MAKEMKKDPYVRLEGWLTVSVARGLIDLMREHDIRTVLEIGTYCALSTVLLASHAKHVTTVDPYDGGTEGYLKGKRSKAIIDSQRQIVGDNLKAFGIEDRVRILACPSDKAAEVLRAEGAKFDMVYIDGSHERDQVERDIANFLPMAVKIICGDDYTEAWPGVRAAVDSVLGRKADTERRLWVYTKPL